MRLFITLALSSIILLASEGKGSIHKIDNSIKKRVVGKSWKRGCPVPIEDLRYLKIPYKNFGGQSKMGEMIVNKDVAKEVIDIFASLYRHNYPIRQMRLVSDFGGNDWKSIEADNTSAFNCRPVTGGKEWSNHSYGRAIDINPLENPYISRSGKISHKLSLQYRNRVRHSNSSPQRAMILKNDYIVKLFKSKGWRWGGSWHSVKDYQHFDKPVKHRKNATYKYHTKSCLSL